MVSPRSKSDVWAFSPTLADRLSVPSSRGIPAGDGARWIWGRCDALIEDLGIGADRVFQVIDWSHAVSTLHTIAEARKGWTPKERTAWVRRAKRLLHAGRIEELVRAIDAIAIGRSAKEISQHRDYFARNVARMQYAAFVAASIPTGSGTVESATRRVINMRMKSNGMFWLEVDARGMLLLRSHSRGGRLRSPAPSGPSGRGLVQR